MVQVLCGRPVARKPRERKSDVDLFRFDGRVVPPLTLGKANSKQIVWPRFPLCNPLQGLSRHRFNRSRTGSEEVSHKHKIHTMLLSTADIR